MTPGDLGFNVRLHVGLALEILTAVSRVYAARDAFERSIELSVLAALIELHEMSAQARRDLGIDGDPQINVRTSFAIALEEPPPPLPVFIEQPLSPELLSLALARPANELPI